MAAKPIALIVEDNTKELREIADLIDACGLLALETRSPYQATRLLRSNRPVLAVVDWNMEHSPEMARTSEEVLRALARDHRDAYTIVYATGVNAHADLAERVGNAHPAAITHDKILGLETLKTRILRLLTTQLGDIRVDRGSVLHEPSRLRFPHQAAVKLLIHHPSGYYAGRRTGDSQALVRFRAWLREVGSPVAVQPEGSGFYRLELQETPRRAARTR